MSLTPEEFRTYKRPFVQAARELLRTERSPVYNEAAVPAYANPNPLMSFLFWERIRLVMNHLGDAPRAAVLDFGCGIGVMLPFLARISPRVVAMDLDLSPLRKVQGLIHFPPHIVVHDARTVPVSDLPSEAFDVVLALDVLEHVEDLPSTLDDLCRVVAPGGEVIVSGPTENLAYRLGRRIAGAEYSGDYHVRDIACIRRALAERAEVGTLGTLFPLIPLFRIISGRPPPARHRR